MNFNDVLKKIKTNFSPRKKVDFDEAGLHFELEPLTAEEEIKILESCKDVEDNQYIETLKRHSLACSIKKINDIELGKDVEYEENGKKVSRSKFLYMLDFLSQWPSSLIDLLFDAFTNMSKEIENKIIVGAKFERFNVSEEVSEEEKKETFRRVPESELPVGLTDTEKVNEQVKKEIDERSIHMAEVENKAINK